MATQDESLYPYSPSEALGITAAIFFGLLTLLHLFKLLQTRTWFCIPFIVGGIFELVGYGARVYSHYYPALLAPFIAQSILILLAPILFAASVYMFLSRIMQATGSATANKAAAIKPSRVTKVFVAGDVVCFFVQAAGAGKLSNAETEDERNSGKYTVLGGLFLQLLVFGFFLLVAVQFHRRVFLERHRADRNDREIISTRLNFQRYLLLLYAVSLFITVRNVFRVIEYAMGDDGYLLANEWPIYVFDALLMAIALIISVDWYVDDIVAETSRRQQRDVYRLHSGGR